MTDKTTPASPVPQQYLETELTIRDYFAAKVMQALLSNPNCPRQVDDDELAKQAFYAADAMLRAREAVGDMEFRLAPSTILVNGMEVPAPERVAPEMNEEYFFPSFCDLDCMYTAYSWSGDEVDRGLLSSGLVYLDRHSAIARAKAMLLTQEPNQ